MEWQLLDRETAQDIWNKTLNRFSASSVYQSFEWGEYRNRVSGVRPYRWIALDDTGEVVALFQGLLIRRYFDLGIVIGEGGPVGNLDGCLHTLQETILKTLSLKKCYCRIYPKRPYDVKDALLLKSCNWQRALCTFSSGWSMWLDLTQSREEILRGFSRNWRYNLQKAYKKDLHIQFWSNPKPDEILNTYTSMESLKGLEQQFSELEIQKMIEIFGDKLVLYYCTDQNGEILSLRGCIFVGDHALDLFAATSEKGRKTSASYALFWELIQCCIAKGIRFYDLNGIDPFDNPGVYYFKQGTGARTLEYLGEWDWATSERLRILMNLARSNQFYFREKVNKLKQLISL